MAMENSQVIDIEFDDFPINQWEFRDPKLEVPTIYKAYFWGLCKGISPQHMAKNMVRLRTSINWILKFPLN